MAAQNINEREAEIKKRIHEVSPKMMKEIAAKFGCSYAAVFTQISQLIKTHSYPVFPSAKIKKQVMERDAYTCQYCGFKNVKWSRTPNRNFVVDHVVPSFQGGPGMPWNLVACCMSCNSLKKGKTAVPKNIEVLRLINPDWAKIIESNA